MSHGQGSPRPFTDDGEWSRDDAVRSVPATDAARRGCAVGCAHTALTSRPRQLYDSHFSFVWRNLRRLGVPDAILEDAAQDVFLVVHRRWDSFDSRWSSVETWLFGILMRVARNHRRSLRRRAWAIPSTGDVVEVVPSTAAGPAELVARREAVALLDRLLDSLDEEKRAIIVLVDVEQLSVPAGGRVAGGQPQHGVLAAAHGAHAAAQVAGAHSRHGDPFGGRDREGSAMKIMEPPDLDADTRSIIDAARGGHEPNEMARARVRRGVELKLAAGIALAVGPASSAFAGALKVTVAVVAVGAVVGAGVYVFRATLAKHAAAWRPWRRTSPARRHRSRAAARVDVPAPAIAPRRAAHQAPRARGAPAPVAVENVSALEGRDRAAGRGERGARARRRQARAVAARRLRSPVRARRSARGGAHRDRHPRLVRGRPRRRRARGSATLPRALAAVAARRRASTARARVRHGPARSVP